MRIGMILSTSLPAREGIGFYAWNLAHYLRSAGHTVHLITRGEKHKPAHETINGIQIWRPPFWPVYPFHVNLHGRFVDMIVRKLEPELDLIHLHSPLVKAPSTVRPTMVTVHTPMRTDAAAIPMNTRLGLLVKLQAPFSIRVEQHLFAQASRIMTVARSVADELTAYALPTESVAVVGNGVDTTFFHPAVARSAQPNPYFFTACRLAPRKGLEDLIACAEIVLARYPQYRFLIAGSGPLEHAVRQAIRRRGLDQRIVLLGHIADRPKLAELYRNARAYVHPAHYEGLPTVLLEAMACGTPVVATAVSGALDVLNGSNGILVPPRQPAQLAEALFQLIDMPALGEALGAHATETIRAHYSWTAIGKRYLEHYHSMLGGRSV